MRSFPRYFALWLTLLFTTSCLHAQEARPPKVLVVAATDPYHRAMSVKAKDFFQRLAENNHFILDFTTDSTVINDKNLSHYNVFIQLHLAPFNLSPQQQQALEKYISNGGGWIGIHAAGLAGKQFVKDPKPYWQWYENLLGITYNSHPTLQQGTLVVTDRNHPVTRNLPDSFSIRDEWYVFDHPPSGEMRILARADENSYTPKKPMGYHPMIWTNPRYAHVLYIGIGHDTSICADENFAILLRDAILWAASPVPRFHALVLTEKGGIHQGFVLAALDWLKDFSRKQQFDYTVIYRADTLNTEILSRFQVFIQLNFPPYMWSDSSKEAFRHYMEEGTGGWVGFHHASLLGEFDGYAIWPWFSQFMGGIRFKNYIAARASGTVHVEDRLHPLVKNLPDSFSLPDDEWYTYDKDPRSGVHVIAHVDENSYQPPSDIKMGDHPVIWTNEKMKARNVYFQMGHHASLFGTEAFRLLFANAILWAAGSTLVYATP
jgi:type 1 glutamine amidotransferase